MEIPLTPSTPATWHEQAPGAPPDKDMLWIPGGTYLMGSEEFYSEEKPAHWVSVEGFWMDKTPVTNLQFSRFVKATGHVTWAEKAPTLEQYPDALPELLFAGSVVFEPPTERVDMRSAYNWWNWVKGADWRHPYGPGSNLDGKERHPVVHVAYSDVEAYAEWAGKRIPTEAEWERAARGGLHGKIYTWGDEYMPKGKSMANSWQGEFPYENTLQDGYARTSPVGKFPPNGYGLYDMAGNVWEWTSDWYGDFPRSDAPCCAPMNPLGAPRESSLDPTSGIARHVTKGGSHLCAPNYCHRFRPAARQGEPVDTSTSHIGFRLIVRTE